MLYQENALWNDACPGTYGKTHGPGNQQAGWTGEKGERSTAVIRDKKAENNPGPETKGERRKSP